MVGLRWHEPPIIRAHSSLSYAWQATSLEPIRTFQTVSEGAFSEVRGGICDCPFLGKA
jgi:hypothetical protein